MPNVRKQQQKDSQGTSSAKDKVTSGDKDKVKQYSCPRCNEVVEKDGVGCEICDKWFHFKCEELSEEQYEQMMKPETKCMHWFCKDCDKDTMSLGKTINSMKVKQEKMEVELANLRQAMNNCNSELKLRPTKPEVTQLVKSSSADLNKEIELRPTKTEVLTMIETKLAEHVVNLAEKERKIESTCASIAAKHVDNKMEEVTV